MADAEVPLSEREIEVLQLVATGAANQEIARDLVISVNTVKVHLRNIFEKLGVQSRTEATLRAIREGWVTVDGLEAAVADASSESAAALAAPVALPEPLAWWQRVYGLAALSLALILLFLPAFGQEEQAAVAANPISDRPASGPAPLRAETSRFWRWWLTTGGSSPSAATGKPVSPAKWRCIRPIRTGGLLGRPNPRRFQTLELRWWGGASMYLGAVSVCPV
jgi:DNA-binding CsgD family transcriptional regulator